MLIFIAHYLYVKKHLIITMVTLLEIEQNCLKEMLKTAKPHAGSLVPERLTGNRESETALSRQRRTISWCRFRNADEGER